MKLDEFGKHLKHRFWSRADLNLSLGSIILRLSDLVSRSDHSELQFFSFVLQRGVVPDSWVFHED